MTEMPKEHGDTITSTVHLRTAAVCHLVLTMPSFSQFVIWQDVFVCMHMKLELIHNKKKKKRREVHPRIHHLLGEFGLLKLYCWDQWLSWNLRKIMTLSCLMRPTLWPIFVSSQKRNDFTQSFS